MDSVFAFRVRTDDFATFSQIDCIIVKFICKVMASHFDLQVKAREQGSTDRDPFKGMKVVVCEL